MKRIVFLIAVVFLLTACATAPVETATLLPSTTPTKAITPTLTATITSIPTPTKFAFPLPSTGEVSPYPTKTYYDEGFGYTLEYPAHWEQVGIREFAGPEGSIKISELKGYSSLWVSHVCIGYLYSTFHDNLEIYQNISTLGSPYVCSIFGIPSELPNFVKSVIIKPFQITNGKASYLIIEYESFPEIFWDFFDYVNLSFDYEKQPTPTDSSPTPQPRMMILKSGLLITEYFSGPAALRDLYWDTNSLDPSLAEKNTPKALENCLLELSIGENHYVVTDDYPFITVKENGSQIFMIKESVTPYNQMRRFCSMDNHWLLEVDGFLIQDGKILNYEYGYEEMFGLHFIKGKLFYFFVQDGKTYISYNGEILQITYDFIFHNGCCAWGNRIDLKGNDEMIWFYGVHDDAWYFVEVSLAE